MEINEQRLQEYDLLKGIAISSVVVFHIISHYSQQHPFYGNISRICSQFQIPVFLFVSGFFFYHTLRKKESFYAQWKKKIIRILLPYFVVGSLHFFSKAFYLSLKGAYELNLDDYFKSLVTLHDIKVIHSIGLGVGPAWFLLMLFVLMVISYVCSKIDPMLVMAVILLCVFLTPPLEKRDFSLSSILYYLTPFQMGCLLNSKQATIKAAIDKYWIPLMGVLLSLIVLINILITKEVFQIRDVIISIVWVTFLYVIAEKLKFTFHYIRYLGRHSMVIFLWHSPYFVYLGVALTSKIDLFTYLRIVLVFLICVTGPLLLGLLYKRLPGFLSARLCVSGKL
ncbi:MAG: acyltransferase [Sedimentisphaerales bacterium]|nr:acyltransferase [Sedimentisphaerales bacterium]